MFGMTLKCRLVSLRMSNVDLDLGFYSSLGGFQYCIKS